MVDASAIGQHESSGREHHEQSVLDDFGSILFLYAPRKNLHTVGDLQHCVNCEYVWLAGNKLNPTAISLAAALTSGGPPAPPSLLGDIYQADPSF